jgi:hypothetical protein
VQSKVVAKNRVGFFCNLCKIKVWSKLKSLPNKIVIALFIVLSFVGQIYDIVCNFFCQSRDERTPASEDLTATRIAELGHGGRNH